MNKKLVQLKDKSGNSIDPINKNYEIEISKLKEEVAKLGGTLLWINPDPLAAFPSQQISLSNSNYDMFETIYMLTTYGGYRYRKSTGKLPFEQGEKINLESVNYDGNRGVVAYGRVFTETDKTSLSFTNCERYYDIGAQVDNTYLIPLYIIGYNTGLFD